MDPTTQRLFEGAAGAGGEVLGIEDVFSTWLYTGNSSTQTITNGIDLSGEGGLVWTKARVVPAYHALYDTERGATKFVSSNATTAETTSAVSLTSFNSDGFTLGPDGSYGFSNLADHGNYASWTFRKAKKFFDVVTYTGNGTTQNITHNLGTTPGFIVIKRTDSSSNWICWHRNLTNTTQYVVMLNSTSPQFYDSFDPYPWNNTAPTSTQFSVGYYDSMSQTFGVNVSGATYVAYLFAHDAGGFGDDGTESVIKCGSHSTTSGSVTTVDLGWEPQWLLWRIASPSGANWYLVDNMRGFNPSGVAGNRLLADSSNAEAALPTASINLTSTGFTIDGTWAGTQTSCIYIAIRRGPMKTPTDATTVFSAITATVSTGTVRTTGFPIDLQLVSNRPQNAQPGHFAYDRLRGVSTTDTAGGTYLNTTSTAVENTNIAMTRAFTNTGFTDAPFLSGYSAVWWNFRRAPGFFDVVASSASTVSHNLGVAPELVIIKARNTTQEWFVQTAANNFGASGNLDTAADFSSLSIVSSVTSTNFSSIATGANYIYYLFATCPGVSKVGSYTGTATTQQIDCGFTAGARFVLIKRTDSTGDWYVWDSARGITAGNDPYLLLNSTAAEVTSTDYIDTLSTGFEITSTAPSAINASGGSFVFLAVA